MRVGRLSKPSQTSASAIAMRPLSMLLCAIVNRRSSFFFSKDALLRPMPSDRPSPATEISSWLTANSCMAWNHCRNGNLDPCITVFALTEV